MKIWQSSSTVTWPHFNRITKSTCRCSTFLCLFYIGKIQPIQLREILQIEPHYNRKKNCYEVNKNLWEQFLMLLSCKYCSVFVYSETSRNCKLIIVQFNGPFRYIILTVQNLAVLHSSDLISKFRTICMFVSGDIQEVICRHLHDIYPYTILFAYL